MDKDIGDICSSLGLAASPTQVDALQRYLELLQRWNATYNLTAVRDRQAMLTQHLADCLAVVPALQGRALAGRLLDVGSGGGLPGVVIATLLPGWQVTCADAVGKKMAFVRQVVGGLPLPNLRAEHVRIEALQAAPFDVITSRAFASLADFTRLTRHLLTPGGAWMAMKGRVPDDEMAALPAGVQVFHVEQLRVPGLDAQRCLVWMREQPAADALAPGNDPNLSYAPALT
jgi:16S rRNA (guanine527-N7)-methyltransferase